MDQLRFRIESDRNKHKYLPLDEIIRKQAMPHYDVAVSLPLTMRVPENSARTIGTQPLRCDDIVLSRDITADVCVPESLERSFRPGSCKNGERCRLPDLEETGALYSNPRSIGGARKRFPIPPVSNTTHCSSGIRVLLLNVFLMIVVCQQRRVFR